MSGWGVGGLPTSVGVNPGTGEARDVLGCPAHCRLQVGCHLAGVNKFSCGTEEAPALLVPQRQPSDAQGSPKLIKLLLTVAKWAEYSLQPNRTWWKEFAPPHTQGLGTHVHMA